MLKESKRIQTGADDLSTRLVFCCVGSATTNGQRSRGADAHAFLFGLHQPEDIQFLEDSGAVRTAWDNLQ